MIQFEQRAVAFVDVLGFHTLVNAAARDTSALTQLGSLVELLSSAVPILDDKVDSAISSLLIPQHNYVSDCIILSAPLKHAAAHHYDGVDVVAMRVIQLTHFLLPHGYLLRGGLAIGKVWHSGSNIVGPAYQDAYGLEHCGNHPCVLLSEQAQAHWVKQSHGSSRMCVLKDGSRRWWQPWKRNRLMVNGLHEAYIPNATTYGGIEQAYKGYAQLVAQQLDSGLEKRPREKWSWFQRYLAAESSNEKWPGYSAQKKEPL